MGVGEGEDNERQLFEENTRGSQLNGTKLLSFLHSQLPFHLSTLTILIQFTTKSGIRSLYTLQFEND
jgi:hypothetical protein